MNNPTSSLLAGLLLLGTLTTSLPAQEPAAGDPFVKDAAPVKVKKDEPWHNVLSVLEVYALDRADAAAVLESERGGAARYRRVLEYSKAGKARLETLTAITSKSGQRVVNQSCDEVPYSTGFSPSAVKDSHVVPLDWETRDVGEIFELEPVTDIARRLCDVNLAPQRSGLKEFRDLPGISPADDVVFQPQFSVQKLTMSATLRENEAFYLGTMTPAEEPGAEKDKARIETWLAFLRVTFPGPTAEELKPAAKPSPSDTLSMEYRWYSLDRAQARDLLLESAGLNAPWEKMQNLLKEKKARLEQVSTINTKPGRRALNEEVNEVRYPTAYVQESIRPTSTEAVIHDPKPGAETNPQQITTRQDSTGSRQPGYASAFATRNTGYTTEVEPVLSPDGVTVDINQALQRTVHLGPLQVSGAASRYAASPLFESRKINNSQTVLLGRQTLVGTFNPPSANGVNGRTDTGRTWFVFVRVLNEP